MKYYLMNKDNITGSFRLEKTLGESYATDISIYGRLPVGFPGVNKWLYGRQAAKQRQHIKELMKTCGCDTIEGFIRVIHCTSINDTLWVKREDEAVTWNDVSLYRNEFDDVIAKLAFEGVGIWTAVLDYNTRVRYEWCIL